MFCKYCGQRIDDDSTFCSGCGAKLTIAVPNNKTVADTAVNPSKASHKIDITDARDLPPEEEFDPTLKNIMGQFSPFGRLVFIALCILMVVWVATLTIYIFYPEFINYFSTL